MKSSSSPKYKLKNLFCVLTTMLMVAAGPAIAHHSFVSEFTENKETISGVITEVLFRNPHVRFFIDVSDGQGGVTKWEIQTQSVPTLIRFGITEDTLVSGSHVTVMGFRGRNGVRKLFLRELTVPGGTVLRPNPSQHQSEKSKEVF